MKNAFICILSLYVFLIATQAHGDKLPLEEYLEDVMATIPTEDTYLQSLYVHHLTEIYNFSEQLPAYVNERNDYFNRPRDQAETRYLIDVLDKAYKSEPKDWGTIAIALEIAVAGTDEEQLIELCKHILENVKEVPDDRADVVWAASQYLLVKRGLEFTDLVAQCVYADVIGIDVNLLTSPFFGKGVDTLTIMKNRNYARARALNALTAYIPDADLLPILERLSRDHPQEAGDSNSWRNTIAHWIHLAKKGCERNLQDTGESADEDY